jgi:hypothetical protein
METQELLDRYVHAVGEQLPRRIREDVKAELRSLLDEMLDDRARQSQRAPDLELATAVLREFGEPDEVAARYRPRGYLIGPELYPTFLQVARIGLAVLIGLGGLILALALWRSEAPLAQLGRTLWEVVLQIAGLALMNLGLLVLIFAGLERWSARHPSATAPATWNPLDLPAVEDPDRVERGSLIATICFNIGLIVLLDFFPGVVAVFFIDDGVWGRWPLLAPEFQTDLLPWFTAAWALEVALNLAVLWQRRWTPVSRWAEFGLSVLSLIILSRALMGGPILVPAILTAFAKFILAIILVIAVLEAAGQIYRLIGRWFAAPPAPLSAPPR